jgi:hypothetical protein
VKLWCDVESADEARELSAKFGYELVPGFTASKILWLKRNEPHHFARLRHVLLVRCSWRDVQRILLNTFPAAIFSFDAWIL